VVPDGEEQVGAEQGKRCPSVNSTFLQGSKYRYLLDGLSSGT